MTTAQVAGNSALLMLLCRARRMAVRRITCDGRLPVLYSSGTVVIDSLAVRGKIAPVEFGAVRGGTLRVGERVFINQGASVVAHRSIEIGDDARIGDFAAILDVDHHAIEEFAEVRAAPVVIGRNAWIGTRAIVLPGVRVGEHSVVAAGSVVTADVPDRTLMAGVPAKPIRALNASDGWRRG